MKITIIDRPVSQLSFYKGDIEINGEVRAFQVCLDINSEEKRKKINFYADGSKFTEGEKTDILMQFNEQLLGVKINEDIISDE